MSSAMSLLLLSADVLQLRPLSLDLLDGQVLFSGKFSFLASSYLSHPSSGFLGTSSSASHRRSLDWMAYNRYLSSPLSPPSEMKH